MAQKKLCILALALVTPGGGLFAQADQIVDDFEGPFLNSRWVTTFTTKGGGSYRQTSGALNFTVATGSTNIVENNIHVLNTNSLPTDRSWTLVIGMHNSADYSPTYGASQLQLGIFDMRTISPSNTLGVGLTLARYWEKNGGDPLFGFGGTNLPKWHAADGIWTNASSDASAKFIYDATTRILQAFVTTDGNNPVDNNYNYIPAGPASSVSIPPSAKLNFYVIQNVYSVAVPVGRMWVDNYKLSFAPLDGRLYPGLPATLSRRPGQDLFLSVSPRDRGTYTYEWRRNGTALAASSLGRQLYFKGGLTPADAGTYSVVVRRNGAAYATNQTVLTVTNTSPGPAGTDDFTTSSIRWSGVWGFDAHDSYLEVNGDRLDYVLDKSGSENSQAFQIWDNRLPSSQNWEVVIDSFIEPTLNPDRFFALRLDAAVPVNLANGFAALNGLNVSFANSVYGGGRKIQNIKTIPTGDGWLELSEPSLNPSTTNVALRITWNAGTRVLTSFYDTNGATGGYVWTQSATNNLSALPASHLAAGFYAFLSGIAEPSFLVPAGQAYFKNFSVRTGPVIPAQMAPQTAAEGGAVTFTAPGEGTEPITYQWRKNGVAIDGQTNATLTLSSLTGGDSGQYSVFISNSLGTITSSNALLTVVVPPAFPVQATNGLRGNLGAAFRYQPTVTGSAAVFTSSNLPPGLTVNRTNGLITGTPTAAGYYRSALTASNFAGIATLPLNFTIPGTRLTLPFSEEFARITGNRFLAVNFSRTNLEARHATTNNRLQFSALSNALAQEQFPEPIPGLGKAVAAYIANLALPTTQPWMVEADLGISGTGAGGLDPGQGLAGLDIFVDTTNRPLAEGLARRLNFFFHDWSDSRRPSVSVNGANDDVDGEYEPSLTNWPTSSAKVRLVLGISGTNRLLSAWATEDLTGRTGWQQVGKTLELNPAGTTNPDHHPLGQSWNLSTNEVFSLALFGQFDEPGQATWIDNVRVTTPLAPVITSTTNLIGQVGRPFNYTITATNSPISFAASNLPAGLEVNSATGLITGTPTTVGRITNVVISANSPAGTGRRTNTAVILPAFTSPGSATGFVNDAGFSHTVVVDTHPFGAELRFSASGLPTGMTINASNGIISGRPTVAGSFPATVTITAFGASASQRVDFTIQGAAGGAFSLTLNPRPTNVLNLPAGLSYSRSSGVISGTPQGWGSFTATGQLSNGTTTNISIPVMPSVPVIAGPTNWNAQVGQPASYQIVAGGFGREWAGFDDFSTNGGKWILSGSRGTTLLVTNGALLNRSTQATDNQDGLAYWQRLMPRTANWEIWMRAFLPTNLLPSNAPSAQSFKLGLFLLNQARNNGQVWETRHYFSESRYVAQYKRLNNLADSTKLDVSLGSSPRAEYDLTMKFTASNGVLRGFVFDGAGNEIVNQTLPLPAGLGSSFSPGIISECNNSTLNPTSAFSADDFLILPDPDDIEYRAFLVGTNFLPEGLAVDSRTGFLAGIIPTNVSGGVWRIRVEAEYKTNNLPIQGLPAVRGGTNLTLTLLPAFTATNAATFLLNATNRTHTVGIGTNTFLNLRFSAAGLPAGLVINATSGVISGRPTAAGSYGVRATITAGTATAFQDLLLSVHNGDGNRWVVGSLVRYQVNLGAGVTGYQATGLPTGLSINASGLISGTPREAGEFNVTVAVPARGLSTVIPFFIRPIYVNLAATGANNGTTWADAYTNLQTAINAAGAGSQIWVAAGTYKPSQYLDPKVTSDPRSRSFLLKGGVSVLGGFAGTETQLAQRDVDANPTILSGDFNGNDSPAWPPVIGNNGNVGSGDSTRSENAYHVVGVLAQTTAPVLDGFTVTGGNANNVTYLQPNNGFIIPAGIPLHGSASALAVINSDLVVKNCHVVKNVGKAGAGGIFNLTGQLRRIRIADAVFERNLAYYGNGAAFEGQVFSSQNVVSRPLLQVTVVRSAFLQNESRTGPDEDNDLYPDGGDGGAVYFYWGVEGNFVNCAFIDNYANGKKADGTAWYDTSSGGREGNGGAIQARRYCDVNIANSIFAGNLCDDNGGAINIESGVRLKMYFSTFFENDSIGNERKFNAGVVFGWYGANSLRPNTVTGYGIVAWQNPPIEQEIDLNQGDWVWSPSLGEWIAPPLPAPSAISQSVFSTTTSLTNNIGNPTLRFGDPSFVATNNLAGADGSYLTDDDGLRIRSGSLAQNLVTSARPNDFADLDEDGNTTEPLPFDAAGVAYPANPPYQAGAYQTIAP